MGEKEKHTNALESHNYNGPGMHCWSKCSKFWWLSQCKTHLDRFIRSI